MFGGRRFARYVCYFVAMTMLLMSMPVQTIQAAMVRTETVLTLSTAKNVRENFNQFLKREDVHCKSEFLQTTENSCAQVAESGAKCRIKV